MTRRAPVFDTAEAAEEAFYDALRRGDLTGLMSLWADDDDALCIHPNGPRLVGRRAIDASWSEILSDGGMDVHATSVRIFAGAMLSVHSVIEELQVEGDGGTELLACVATNVYVRDSGGWRLLIHHAGAASDAIETGPTGSDLLH